MNSRSTSIFVQWSQDQAPHIWDLILAPTCFPLELHFFKIILPKIDIFKQFSDYFFMLAILYPSIQWVMVVLHYSWGNHSINETCTATKIRSNITYLCTKSVEVHLGQNIPINTFLSDETINPHTLTLSLPLTTIVPNANSLDPSKTPSNLVSNSDPSCLTLRQHFRPTLRDSEAHWKLR